MATSIASLSTGDVLNLGKKYDAVNDLTSIAMVAQYQVGLLVGWMPLRQQLHALGQAGWLRYAMPAGAAGELGGDLPALDARSLCIVREILVRHHVLADFAFAMQGLGSSAITLAGSAAQQAAYLPAVARGRKIRRVCAFRARGRF